jgi:hypothetical protein
MLFAKLKTCKSRLHAGGMKLHRIPLLQKTGPCAVVLVAKCMGAQFEAPVTMTDIFGGEGNVVQM